MGFLAILIPLAFFAMVGGVAVLLFGVAVPWLAAIPAFAWVASSAMVTLLKLLLLIILFVMPLASILTWMERRQSAMMQDRLGPNRANFDLPILGNVRAFGLLHFVADALKMLFKEDFIPAKANRALFALAPI